MKRRNDLRFVILIAAMAPVLGASSCDCLGLKEAVRDPTTEAVNVLNDAIDALQDASADWQKVLADAQRKLTDDAQSTIRNELANLASRTIAQTGVELRCDVDFIRARVRQALMRIKAKLLGGTVPPLEPALCQVVPLAVDRALLPDRLKQLELYGYDFDQDQTLRVWLERAGLPRVDVTGNLDRPTHYAMTLKFGGNGVQLDDRSTRFVLEWENRRISTIAVIQVPTPVCESRVVEATPGAVTFVPPRVGRGDGDFAGNGPRVRTTVTLLPDQQVLRASVSMRAVETTSDYTEAFGSQVFELFRPEPGWAIEDVAVTKSVSHGYTDSNHDEDSFDLGGGGPVKRLLYVGDTDGSEAGTRTKVNVTFNRIPIELRQTGDCVSQRAVMALKAGNMLSPAALLRLEPRASLGVARVKARLQALAPR